MVQKGGEMKFRVGDTTYTGIKEKSLAWYTWICLQTIGLFAISLVIVFVLWALVSATILVLG